MAEGPRIKWLPAPVKRVIDGPGAEVVDQVTQRDSYISSGPEARGAVWLNRLQETELHGGAGPDWARRKESRLLGSCRKPQHHQAANDKDFGALNGSFATV